MKKVLVIGCPGSGKSTFARKLRDLTGLPLYYLDMIWHRADKTTVSRDVFDKKLKDILENDYWIIDGNYQRTLEIRLKECDTVFLMDFPTEICLAGAEARIGKNREDMPWVETEFDEDFKQWIVGFSKEFLPKIYELLEKYKDKRTIVVFRTREETDAFLKDMEERVTKDDRN